MSTQIGNPGASTQAAAPVRLGKYVLDAPLGMGGMAEVFRGHTVGAEGFERPVAIKRVLPDASRNPAFADMFISEAKLSARMQHANIVSVLDFDREPGGIWYVNRWRVWSPALSGRQRVGGTELDGRVVSVRPDR